DLASVTEVSTADEPTRCLEKAVRELRQQRIDFHGLQKRRAEDIQKFLSEAEDFSLMLAYYWNTQPYLWSVSFMQGISQRDKRFATLGCGANVATFILSW